LLALAGNLRTELAFAARHARPRGASAPAARASFLNPEPRTLNPRPYPGVAVNSTDPGLASRVAAAIQHSRQTRAPLTLALVELDRFADVLIQLGPAGATEAAHALQFTLADWTSQRVEALLVSDSRLALLWEGCPRSEALQFARSILAKIGPWSREQFPLATDLTLSIGLATLEFASKNYPASELIDAADRCLNGAQLSGGNTVKSIAF
jgi:GGDEF domain-containing protein